MPQSPDPKTPKRADDDPAGRRATSGRAAPGLPATVWMLGLVSMFMDISTEMVHALLPVFLVSVLGLGAVSLGLVAGIGEATASLTRIFSGALSDYFGRRKLLALAGYGIAALSKPLFPLASNLSWIVLAHFIDRMGKGIRVAPRDALIADVTDVRRRGGAYGLRKALDSAGATVGPLLAIALMALTGGEIRTVYWFALIPALLAVAVLAFGVREPRAAPPPARRFSLRRSELGKLGGVFWSLLVVVGLLHLAMLSEAFMLLRAVEIGLRPGLVPLVLVVMNLVYALSAYPIGHISDRRKSAERGRGGLLFFGFAPFIGANLVLFGSSTLWHVLAAAVLWGVHLGATRGLLPAMIADVVPREARATAFGVFHFVAGITLLPANAIAGLIWEFYGAQVTFVVSACIALFALGAFGLWRARYGRL
jgi:MFS family permease